MWTLPFHKKCSTAKREKGDDLIVIKYIHKCHQTLMGALGHEDVTRIKCNYLEWVIAVEVQVH